MYRLRLEWDSYEKGTRIPDLLAVFYNHPNAPKVQELVIGAFDFENNGGMDDIVESLVAAKHKLPALQALFLGDITYEENEISWIE